MDFIKAESYESPRATDLIPVGWRGGKKGEDSVEAALKNVNNKFAIIYLYRFPAGYPQLSNNPLYIPLISFWRSQLVLLITVIAVSLLVPGCHVFSPSQKSTN
jgi:hypothetical protein